MQLLFFRLLRNLLRNPKVHVLEVPPGDFGAFPPVAFLEVILERLPYHVLFGLGQLMAIVPHQQRFDDFRQHPDVEGQVALPPSPGRPRTDRTALRDFPKRGLGFEAVDEGVPCAVRAMGPVERCSAGPAYSLPTAHAAKPLATATLAVSDKPCPPAPRTSRPERFLSKVVFNGAVLRRRDVLAEVLGGSDFLYPIH